VGHGLSNGGDPPIQGVVGGGHGDAWRGLGLAVGYHHLSHVHESAHLLHELDGTGRSGHYPRAQAGKVVLIKVGVLELGHKHGGNAMQSSALLLLHRGHHRDGIEVLGGKDHGGSVGHAGHIGEDHTEAVVEGDGNAEAVLF